MSNVRRVGVYPGTFDPPTNGHLDIITRATRLVDRLIVGIAANPGKDPLFTLDERVEMVKAEVASIPNGDGSAIQVESFDILLMDFVNKVGASMIVRGLRAVSDFEYEFQMALMNRHLDCRVETVFLMPSEEYAYVTSSHIKAVASHGGNVASLVPKAVEKRLAEKFGLPGGGRTG